MMRFAAQIVASAPTTSYAQPNAICLHKTQNSALFGANVHAVLRTPAAVAVERTRNVTAHDSLKQAAAESEIRIENLNTEYCDEFACTSSPAVEQTIRSLCRDLQRPRTWTRSLFAENVTYQGGLRKFKGATRYARFVFIADNVGDPQVTINRVQMLEGGTAEIQWRLQGKVVGALSVDIDVSSFFSFNQLTGRVEEHRDSFDFSRCGLPGRLAFTALRSGWAARQNFTDFQEDSGKWMQRFEKRDDDMDMIQSDPTDPNKFFIQEDTTFNDAVLFAAVVSLFWVFAQAYQLLDKAGH